MIVHVINILYNNNYMQKKRQRQTTTKISKQLRRESSISIKRSQKLQQRYKSDKYFKQKIDERSNKYGELLKASKMKLEGDQIDKDLFICYHQSIIPIYFYFGMMHDCRNESKRNNILHFVKYFNQKPSQDYYFVFLNNHASYNALQQFKQIFLQLTIQHFLHLKEFIVVKPHIFQRARNFISFDMSSYGDSSNVFSQYLSSVTKEISSTIQLCNYLQISPQNLVDIFPRQIAKIQFPQIQPKKFKLQNQRINFYGQLLNEKQRQLRNQFQRDMKSFLIIKPGQQTLLIQDYETNQIGIPLVLFTLIYYFEKHPEGLKIEGLFRKSVSIQQQYATFTELLSKHYEFFLNITNPHLIANLIKRFFSNLKIPIFPYKQFLQLMHDQGVSDKKQLVKKVVNNLKNINNLCLMFLIQFLKQKVVTHVQYNKMTQLNLSICFAPCLLRSQKSSAADLIFANKCAIIVRILLQNFEYIFGTLQERKKKYRMNQDNITRQFQCQIHQSIMLSKKQNVNHKGGSQVSNKQCQQPAIVEQVEIDFYSELPPTQSYNSYNPRQSYQLNKPPGIQDIFQDDINIHDEVVQQHRNNTFVSNTNVNNRNTLKISQGIQN